METYGQKRVYELFQAACATCLFSCQKAVNTESCFGKMIIEINYQ
jgi:hypothetical protein